ncbi:MAG TPA: hypothetical protein DCK93_07585 [Blastocatellia bacterium]|jgi:hypothetical protein|nr:hypothetical protein [Blastocatellia bacterium]HAF22765.1 hypothetical protein [Blastocatellia bacterium]
MKKIFVASLSSLILVLGVSLTSYAQAQSTAKAAETPSAPANSVAITATSSPMDLARAALAAQGGEKFKTLKSMVLRGSVDLYPPNSTQSIPGAFLLVIAGEKVRLEIDARPAVSFKTIFDGQRSYSSLPGVDLPPASKFGLPLLAKFDQAGYAVTALPDKKKQRGFRIADSDGNATDFYVDVPSGRVMEFVIPFNGYTFATENTKQKDVDGVLVSYAFTQRLEMPQGAFFAEYKVKDVKLNNPIGDDVFAMPN